MGKIYMKPDEVIGLGGRIKSIVAEIEPMVRDVGSILESLEPEVKKRLGGTEYRIADDLYMLYNMGMDLGSMAQKAGRSFMDEDSFLSRDMEAALKGMESVAKEVAWLNSSDNARMGVDGSLKQQFYRNVSLEMNESVASPVGDYLLSSVKQVVLGDFTDDMTLLGTGLQVLTGIVGIDLPADIRDLTASLVNWEWSGEHILNFALNLVGVIPVIGALKYLKYADEAAVAIKGSDRIVTALKNSDELSTVLKKGDEAVLGSKEVLNGGLKTLSTPSSKVLRQNMIESGINVPNYANAAHHIVAGSSPKAAEARAILQKFGVDINDATNGAFLPTVKDVAEGAYHPSLHTDSYYRKVTDLLSGAKSKNDVLDILDDIADQLSKGTFK
ncbi:HNH/ENDO VII superfamily nuclease [Anaerobacterium chartisolvens]|uniref:HNH/ENDO VII superfamily nuclease n=1 Tax=Anaerobacterium chartisolvens TaxID=1297424 RepID=A0A369AXF2_9FIRM|nr:AHH domain-containing protein [Anaerobacterium chartisolvens]RCX13018.1 HNH/ENDO VII superfamily nuclease [Anaerobacterium chartisolvens]